MKFVIEQIAICPPNPRRAKQLLSELGLAQWVEDIVVAEGFVLGEVHQPAVNAAELSFNYQARKDCDSPLEFEVLHYTHGPNWMRRYGPSVSHLGMHCTAEELEEWRHKFSALGIPVAQAVDTQSHSNPAIKDSRRYTYVIFDTRAILGVDLKFIVRRAIA